MKQKSVLRAVLTAMLSLVATAASAIDFNVNGIYYILNDDDCTASVSFKGNTYSEYPDEYTGNVVIPSSFENDGKKYTVTSIGKYAFRQCESLISVTIPNSVTSIGEYSFHLCKSLTSVTIPNSVTSIGEGAFYSCSALPSINIPSSVTSIEFDAFANCDNLKRVDITSLEDWLKISFSGETSNPFGSLSYSEEPETTVKKYLYLNGEKIENLVIPNSITTIGNYVFTGCTGLTSLTLHDTVNSIGEGAFANCTGLTSVNLCSVSEIGVQAFAGCSSLKSVAIPTTVNTIYEYAFMESGLTRVDITSLEAWLGIKFYGEFANPLTEAEHLYLNDVEIKDLVIPNTITEILWSAFHGCTGLTSVTFPSSVKTIGYSAFKGCRGLTDVTIPSSVTEIGGDAFLECSGLINVNISSLEDWLKIYIDSYNSNPLAYAKHLYLNGVEIKDLVVPNSITTIQGHSFSGFSGLTSVNIPNSVTEFGSATFYCCDNLKTIYFNAENCSDSYSNSDVFKVDNYLDIIIGKDVKHAPAGMFQLQFIQKVPKRVISQAATPPTYGSNVFNDKTLEEAILYVPSESLLSYQSHEGWMNFKKIVGISNPITAIALGEKNNAIAPYGKKLLTSSGTLDEITLTPGGSKQLTATITPSDATIADILEWTSSNQNVAVVDANGLISAIGEGTATITAKACDGSGVYATCKVNVRSGASNVEELIPGENIVGFGLQGVKMHNDLLYACTTAESVNKSTPTLHGNAPDNMDTYEDRNFDEFAQRDWVVISGLGSEYVGKELSYPFVAQFADGVLTPSGTITATAAAKAYNLNTFRAENILHGGYSNYDDDRYQAYYVPVRENEVAKFMGFIETVNGIKYLYSDNANGRKDGEGIKIEGNIADNSEVYSILEGILVADASTKAGVKIIMLDYVGQATGVEGIDTAAARIYSANGNIIIAATEDGEAAVYDFTGRLIWSVPVASGNSTAVPVAPGCYIVKTGTKTQSVVVK
ncbi:MAG: leucine-rich repeat protein [Bacteroidales bacterium]|nr:leucine-rich repeat protein [Bacteroidales bacterium]